MLEQRISGTPEESVAGVSAQGNTITQELVEKLADKVMKLLLEDLKNESERYRLPSRKLEGRRSTFGNEGGR
jgi:hypothetical protein